MSDPGLLTGPALGLVLLLGLRHGLDPDHIAVVDNLTFRATEERPCWAPWTGTLFAIGHSLSVAAVAIGVAALFPRLAWPDWASAAIDWADIGLLILVGALNFLALRRPGAYTPVGWRQGLIPRAVRSSSHPLAVITTGIVFGLVFDTATQAAAWGLAASSTAGVGGAATVAAVFALGMILTDTADSRIIASLLRDQGDPDRVRRYRRGVGWLIVAMSFGMAGYALAGLILSDASRLPDQLFTALGVGMAVTVVGLLLWGHRNGHHSTTKLRRHHTHPLH